MNLAEFIARLYAEGKFGTQGRDLRAQFGLRPNSYLGATLLPERLVNANMFRERQIRYRTIVATAGARYSPVQRRQGGALFGSFLVELGHSDIGTEITAEDYDQLVELLEAGNEMQAEATVLGLTDTQANQALVAFNEKQRWQAIVNAQVELRGDNAYTENVPYPNPTGHRAAVAGTWSTDTYDPMADILGMKEFAEDKGIEINRIVASSNVVSILLRNRRVAERSSPTIVTVGSNTYIDPLDVASLNAKLRAMGLPGIEVYNGRYYDEEGAAHRFLPTDRMCFFGSTGRIETVEPVAGDPFYLEDTLGYMAVGRAAGQSGPGRRIRVEAKDDKPPRIDTQAWQTSLPVIQDPESIFVLSGVA